MMMCVKHSGPIASIVAAFGLAAVLAVSFRVAAEPTVSVLPTVLIPAARFEPLYPPAQGVRFVDVAAFNLMTRPVTNGEFLAFVTTHPRYRRGEIPSVFADTSYLSHWSGGLSLGQAKSEQPVTRVSWFAAKAFCEAHGMRLPTESEWELAAAASATRKDARKDPIFIQRLLDWYGTSEAELPSVPHGPANLYGVHDLHGVIWEWVHDFNNAVVIADSRGQRDTTRDRFCGGGALLSSNVSDYPAFMRIAMRSSLEAGYTSHTLGFRCATDAPTAAKSKRRKR